jgi:hypothetical protein
MAIAEPAYKQMLIDAGIEPRSTQAPKNLTASRPMLLSGTRS